MSLSFDVQNILVLLVGFIGMIYGLIVYSGNKTNKTNIWFFLFVLSVAFWSISMFFFRSSIDVPNAIFWARILYLSATFIPACFLGFSYIFPEDKTFLSSWKNYLIFIPFALVAVLSLLPNVLILNVNIFTGKEKEIIFNKPFYVFYSAYINIYFGWNYFILIKKYFKSSGVVKTQLAYIIIGTLVSTLIGVTTNLLLPTFGIFALNWVGQVGLIVMLTTIFYAILKHHLFDIKIIATEILTFIVWIVLLVQFILADTLQAKFLGLSLLSFVSIFGVLLVKSVIKEVRAREKIEELATKLEFANLRLKQLDEAKSDFLSIASHQLRTPLTAIKGYASMILEGSYGKISATTKSAVDKIFQSSQRLVLIIGDFLDISHIEQGTMQYDFAALDVKELAKGLTDEFKATIESSIDKSQALKISFEADEKENFSVNADRNKIRQVVSNLIDNSIKYTPAGFVKVNLSKIAENGNVLLKIEDSGIGISAETMPNLFKKFGRAKSLSSAFANGSGLGLYVAKEIIKAHKGKIWAESEGEGKGSKFFVELGMLDILPSVAFIC